MEISDLNKKSTFIASDSLLDEAKNKKNDFYINLGFTDYGGSFMDKVTISYFRSFHSKNIVFEKTSWSGMNAFIFGKPAKELYESTRNYPLGYENLEEYYFRQENSLINKTARQFIKDNEISSKRFDEIVEWLTGKNIEPNYIDFCYTELLDFLNK